MTTDHTCIRECLTCPDCLGPKDQGLLVCWPCNRLQKTHNDGGYSERLTRRLGELESFLTCETMARVQS